MSIISVTKRPTAFTGEGSPVTKIVGSYDPFASPFPDSQNQIFDGTGNLYFVSPYYGGVYVIPLGGNYSLFAGSGDTTTGYTCNQVPYTNNRFTGPCDVSLDKYSNLYVCDNSQIQIFSTVGTQQAGVIRNGSTTLNVPNSSMIAVNPLGTLLATITDTGVTIFSNSTSSSTGAAFAGTWTNYVSVSTGAAANGYMNLVSTPDTGTFYVTPSTVTSAFLYSFTFAPSGAVSLSPSFAFGIGGGSYAFLSNSTFNPESGAYPVTPGSILTVTGGSDGAYAFKTSWIGKTFIIGQYGSDTVNPTSSSPSATDKVMFTTESTADVGGGTIFSIIPADAYSTYLYNPIAYLTVSISVPATATFTPVEIDGSTVPPSSNVAYNSVIFTSSNQAYALTYNSSGSLPVTTGSINSISFTDTTTATTLSSNLYTGLTCKAFALQGTGRLSFFSNSPSNTIFVKTGDYGGILGYQTTY